MVEAEVCTAEMKSKFSASNEPIMFQSKIKKLSRFNIEQ